MCDSRSIVQISECIERVCVERTTIDRCAILESYQLHPEFNDGCADKDLRKLSTMFDSFFIVPRSNIPPGCSMIGVSELPQLDGNSKFAHIAGRIDDACAMVNRHWLANVFENGVRDLVTELIEATAHQAGDIEQHSIETIGRYRSYHKWVHENMPN